MTLQAPETRIVNTYRIACDGSDPILVKSVFNEQVWFFAEGQLVLQVLHEGKKHFKGLLSFNKVYNLTL